jgi:alcohol dehydrogenase class IV
MLKLPQRLSALGVEKICLPDVAAAAMRDQAHRSNPKSMTREEYLQLLEQAF